MISNCSEEFKDSAGTHATHACSLYLSMTIVCSVTSVLKIIISVRPNGTLASCVKIKSVYRCFSLSIA